ncbi:MAG: bifunctional UDP-sugar hydrolase/5'-nucleotidase [Chloroflexota bacterium]|nr:bifunctional UDP-sugar hydrolase/5'-nucleotidase [Chloroflexota bacterium]
MSKKLLNITIVVILLTMIIPTSAFDWYWGEASITLLHTNDFHGRLETDYKGRGGAANLAGAINYVKLIKGEQNVLLLDAGDEFFAAPAISQLLMGESTIDVFNEIGYDLAVLGNHEFDKGQEVLAERVAQSEYPWLGANVVLEGTEWDLPEWAEPYTILTAGSFFNPVRVGVIGVATDETPQVTLLGTTEGLEFKDLTETILHYYDEVRAQADALIVVAHMGTDDSGPYKGLVTVAEELIAAGKPVDLMIGGHQHQPLYEPLYVGDTAIIEAGYYGRWLGRADITINKMTKKLMIDSYELIPINQPTKNIQTLIDEVGAYYADGSISSYLLYTGLIRRLENAQTAYDLGLTDVAMKRLVTFGKQVLDHRGVNITTEAADVLIADAWEVLKTLPDPNIADTVEEWAEIVAPIVNQVVGHTNIDLVRDYNNESNVGDIVTDSMLWSADIYDDGELNGSVDIALTNPGGLRADIVIPEGAALPYPVTWGMTFDVLPFGNTLFLMDLTGEQLQTLFNQSANLYKGILQTSGAAWYWYNDTGTDEPNEWGAYCATVAGEPLDPDMTYRVVTNNFLAGGQDGWTTFAEGTNRWDTYYDMQEGFVEYIGMLEVIDAEDIPMGRIIRLDEIPTSCPP